MKPLFPGRTIHEMDERWIERPEAGRLEETGRKTLFRAVVEDGFAELEVLAEVFLADFGVVGQLLGGAAFQDGAFVEEVGAVGDGQGLVDVVVGDDHADVHRLEFGDDMLDVLDGDRVDAGEGFVEEDEFRVDGQGAGDFAAAALTAGELDALVLADFLETELVDQRLEPVEAVFLVEAGHFHDREDVVLHAHRAEDRGFLRQIADAFLGALVHRKAGDLLFAEEDAPVVGLDQAGDHIEAGGLAGTVGAEQAHDFTLLHFDGDALDDRTLAVLLDQIRAE